MMCIRRMFAPQLMMDEMMGHLHVSDGTSAKSSRRSMILAWLLVIVSAAIPALAGPVLDSREYKVALAPAKFAGPNPSGHVAELWEKLVKPVIGRLEPRGNGKPRFKESFDPNGKARRIVFRDTSRCALRSAGFALRERAK